MDNKNIICFNCNKKIVFNKNNIHSADIHQMSFNQLKHTHPLMYLLLRACMKFSGYKSMIIMMFMAQINKKGIFFFTESPFIYARSIYALPTLAHLLSSIIGPEFLIYYQCNLCVFKQGDLSNQLFQPFSLFLSN